ncbi:hypothetical protein LR48_Vigan07g179600 [Vigna angularis]|uniref:Uncharacterized protein n=1 Tax=Phaseolus angularis TaxID=3914 RepID=A0A0L9UZT5_PHAAN|nr:hypothetical protein LR48_Vigan07g179600 [Vigna angularis]
MKGDCYSDLVEVFYNDLRVINCDVHSRIKGVDIIINDDVWLLLAGLKVEGCMSHVRDSLHNKWTTKKQIYKDSLRDYQTQVISKAELSDSDENFISFTLEFEFERYVVNIFERTSEKSVKLEKSVFRMENKMDELIKNYVDSSSSTEVSDDNDESSEEDFMDESNSE